MPDSIKEILSDAEELHSRKEDDYGESWRLTGQIMAQILQQQGKDELVIPAEPEYLSALGLYTRRLDKIIRSFNGTFVDDDLSVDEGVSETAKDQIPYSAMQTLLAQEMEDMNPEPEYEYCDSCGQEAVDRTSLTSTGPEEYEYYCTCGNAWWGS